MKHIAFVVIVILPILYSCGSDNKGPKVKKIVSERFGEPQMLYLQDDDCSGANALKKGELESEVVSMSVGTRESVFSLDGFSGSPLSGGIVKNVFHSAKYSTRYRYNRNSKTLSYLSGKVLKNPSKLYICQARGDYSDYSIEGASLNSIFSLQKASDFFHSARPSDTLERIDLNMFTRIIREVIVKETEDEIYMGVEDQVDNAFYSFEDKSISFLPKDLDNSIFGLYPAWEIPFVSAHEFGHHVLNNFIPADSFENFNMAAILDEHQRRGHLDHEGCSGSLIVGENKSAGGGGENEGFVKIFKAYHEAFADLYAYLSLGREYNSLGNVRCMSKARNLDYQYFGNYDKKELSEYVLNHYFNGTAPKPTSCQDPVYRDSHTLGAILAHVMNKMLEKGAPLSREQKFNILVDWVKTVKMRFLFMRNLPPKKYLKKSLGLFFSSILKATPLLEGHCSYVDDAFRGLGYRTKVDDSDSTCKIYY